MSQVAENTGVPSRKIASFYAPIAAELDDVERLLHSELSSDHPAVHNLVLHAFSIGGKRLRPALLLLCARAVGEITREHVVLAAVIEMIHTATLVHDDVLDEATLRRHVETVNARWNNESSVLLGDFLFTHAFYLAATLGSTYACRTIGRATNIVCEGELRQTASSGNFNLSEGEYVDIITAKTAELCACCCQLGAHYAASGREVEAELSQFGRHLGIAFQITDDLLDLLGDERTMGKSLGTDLAKRKPTLPLIHALRQVSQENRARYMPLLDGKNGRRRDLLTWLEQIGALDYAREKARHHAQAAQSHLARLDVSPSRAVLEQIAKYVVDRVE